MEFKDYLEIMRKRIWILIVVTIIVTLGVYFYTVKQPVTYDSSANIYITIKKVVPDNPNYFQYDNYYAQQSSNLFADTVIAWVQDPSNVVEIFNNAQIATPEVNLQEYSKLINAKKKQGGAVQITFNSADKSASENIIAATTKFIENKSAEWNQSGLTENIFIDSSKTASSEHKTSLNMNIIIGIISGVIIGLVAIFMAEYFRKK